MIKPIKSNVEFKLGKAPARRDAVKLKLSTYLDVKHLLPKVPTRFGHMGLIGATGWGMLANDSVGDCVIAGAMHETMLWNRIAGKRVDFTDENAITTYSRITKYDPTKTDAHGNNPTDQGTDMQMAASYRRRVGVVDAAGNPHAISAYVALTPGSVEELRIAMYLFSGVGLGLELPTYAIDQFNAGKPWDVLSRGSVEGGHYVPGFGRTTNNQAVSWGRGQGITDRFIVKFMDEGVAYMSDEYLVNGKSPEGFDRVGLLADLEAVSPGAVKFAMDRVDPGNTAVA